MISPQRQRRSLPKSDTMGHGRVAERRDARARLRALPFDA
jgi:hypothetical protein